MSRKGNHLLFNVGTQNKIAFLLTVDKNKRDFVASKLYKDEAPFLLEQIICQKKAKNKLPLFSNKGCFYTQKSIEQATSQKVAEWKAKYIFSSSKTSNCLSLTGGLGVDDYFLGKYFASIVSLDIDENLNEIVDYNFSQLDVINIKRLATSCEDYILHNQVKDTTIYIDPDRQSTENSTNKNVANFSPNILELVPQLLAGNNSIFIKLSGVTDLTWIEENLPSLKDTVVISEEGEVKEILVHLSPANKDQRQIFAVQIDHKNKATEINQLSITDSKKHLNGSKYIFRPFSGIIKTNLLRDNDLSISPNTFLFLTDNLNLKVLGNLFYINFTTELSLKKIKQYLIKESITEASVICRNTQLTSAETKKFLQLKESETTFIFVLGKARLNQLFLCQKVK